MLKKLITLGSFAASFAFSSAAYAQANPTATALSNLQIGGGYTYGRTDYGHKGDKGFTIFADYDIGVHWGLEANYHHTTISTPERIGQKSFSGGPRVILRTHHFKLYGKGVIGIGRLTTPYNDSGSYFLTGGGGGVEYLFRDHLTIRPVDIEYQRWSFRHGLNPIELTTGVAYRFH